MAIKADRFAYVPLIGIFIILVWGIADLSRSKKQWQRMAFITGLLVVGVLAIVARLQLNVWKNSLTLFQHAVHVTDNNASAHNNLGVALKDYDQIDEALRHYHRAFEIEPRDEEARNNLGNLFAGHQKLAEASACYRQTLALNPLAWLLTISNDPLIHNPKETVQLATRAVALDRTGNTVTE